MNKQKGSIGLVLLLLVGLFVVLPILGLVTGIISLPFHNIATRTQMERDIITKTYDADNAIYNYEWFKNRAEAINAAEKKIENARFQHENFQKSAGDRSEWTFEDKNEDARLATIELGLKNHYQDLVAEYNARAQMSNRNIFSEELPLIWELKFY